MSVTSRQLKSNLLSKAGTFEKWKIFCDPNWKKGISVGFNLFVYLKQNIFYLQQHNSVRTTCSEICEPRTSKFPLGYFDAGI